MEGHPDLNGAWQALVTANIDLEDHEAQSGPHPELRRGFTKTSLKPGTEISVDGYQAKDGARRANGRDLTLPDGRTLFLGSSGTGAPSDAQKK